MDQAKSVLQGFIALASVIWLITCVWVASNVNMNTWLGLGLFLFLAVPFSICGTVYLKGFKERKSAQTAVKKAKNVLMSLQGFGFACWFFDVISTFFVINLNQSGSELNPLGWPFSALGALVYYIPITFVVYYLLYKVKSKESFYVTVAVTGISLFMGARNLSAALYNLREIYSFTASTADLEILGMWLGIAVILATVNIVAVIKNKNSSTAYYINKHAKLSVNGQN